MEAASTYAFATLGWHLVQALPLLIWPQAVSGLLQANAVDAHLMHASSPLEIYFARCLGLALVALGMTTVSLSGALPLTGEVEITTPTLSPYAAAVILITTAHHALTATYCWLRYGDTTTTHVPAFGDAEFYSSSYHQTGFMLGFLGSVSLACLGLWCLMFAGEAGHVSRRTGADKRTSGWPFKNAEADKRRKVKGGRSD